VITGANTGLGFENGNIARRARRHRHLACRNEGKAAQAADRIRRTVPGSTVRTLELDLASLASIRRAADHSGPSTPGSTC